MLLQRTNTRTAGRLLGGLSLALALLTVVAGDQVSGEQRPAPAARSPDGGAPAATANQPAKTPAPRFTADAGTGRAYLGVTVEAVPRLLRDHLREALKASEGVVVVAVAADSPAARAGLRPGDILVGLDGQTVFDPAQLAGLMAMHEPEDEIELSVIQVGKRVTQSLRASAVKGEAAAGPAPDASSPTPESPGWRTSVFTIVTGSGVASLTGDGERFSLKLRYRDDHGRARRVQWAGTARQLKARLARLSDLPAELRDAVGRELDGRAAVAPFFCWPGDQDGDTDGLPWWHPRVL